MFKFIKEYNNIVKMGGKSTKVDNEGNIVNTIEVQPATLTNVDILICLYIITTLSILSFLYKLYKVWHKNIKKKYSDNKI